MVANKNRAFQRIPEILLLASSTLTLGSIPGVVAAQSIEEVIVTATRREESLLNVPVSVSVISGEQIREQSLQDLDDLSSWVPGFNVREGGEQTGISIRGFGAGLNFGFDQSVGLFIDGMYSARERQFRGRFLDVSSVEVLRGPQATLFGKNTISGAVIITTGQPSHDFDFNLRGEVTGGAKDARSLEGFATGSLGETLAGRVAMRYSTDDGYLYNTLTGESEEQEDDWILRTTFLWTPSDNIEVKTKLEYSDYERSGRDFQVSDVGGPFSDTTNPASAATHLPIYLTYDPLFEFGLNTLTSKQRETAEVQSKNAVIEVKWDLGFADLESVSGYSAFDSEDGRDVDWTPTSYLYEPISQEFTQWSQEFRLISEVGDQFDYILGAYFFGNDFFVDRRTDINIEVFLIPFGVQPGDDIIFGGPAENWRYGQIRFLDQDSRNQSLYGQGTWHFTPSLHLTAGLRWNREEKTAEDRYSASEFGSDRFLEFNQPFLDFFSATTAATRGTPGVVSQLGVLATGDPDATKVANVCATSANLCTNLFNIIVANGRIGGGNLVEKDWSPEVTLSWDATDSMMYYAKYAKGHKGGGFNSQTTGQATDPRFEEETADAFEVGGKFRLENGYVNVALFRQDFDNLQTSVWTGNLFDVGNAGKARSQGVELDTRYLLTENLQMNASLIWLDARFIENADNACSVPQLNFGAPGCFTAGGIAVGQPGAVAPFFQDLTGKRFSSTMQGNIGLGYSRSVFANMDMLLRADATYSGEQENARDPTIQQPSVTLVDLSATLRQQSGPWSVGFLVKNATDKVHWWYEFEAPVQPGTRIGFMAPPRTYALRFTYDHN